MEFDLLSGFFSSLTFAKRRYPIIVTYTKHLKNIAESSELKDREVNMFRQFLINNTKIGQCLFDQPDFKTGKHSCVIAMENFIIGEQRERVWSDLLRLEEAFLPNGREALVNSAAESNETSKVDTAMNILKDNPVFADVFDQVKGIASAGDITDISSIMEMPDFKAMVNSIKNGLTSGKYKLSDLTGTVGTIINSVQHDLDPSTRSTLQTVTDTMTAIEQGRTPDLSKIMSAVSNLKMDNSK